VTDGRSRRSHPRTSRSWRADQKSQEALRDAQTKALRDAQTKALRDAQTKALRFGHTEVDGEHLLLALLDQADGLAPRLLATAGADPDGLRAAVEEDLGRRPRGRAGRAGAGRSR
jgi:ATP-dependent Clp protease ATP-binding subunit ClpB